MQFREKTTFTLVFSLSLLTPFLAILAMVGCQTATITPAEVIPTLPEPLPAPVDTTEIVRLLDLAELALQDDQLAYPEAGSALALFTEVLTLDSSNVAARRGLERIVERYLELAERAAERRQFPLSRSMLSRARLVEPNHPAIEPMAAQVQLLANARRERLKLDRSLLSARSDSLLEPLANLGKKARDTDCRITITARTDAEGRWLYQQLSHSNGERRIRARLQIGSPPQVEVLCF